MKTITRLLLITFFLARIGFSASSQDVRDPIRSTLDSLATTSIPQLNDTINLSLTNISVSDLLRSVSNHIGININVQPIETIVYNNYSNVVAKDLIVLLCKDYDLKLEAVGSIISLKKVDKPSYLLNLNIETKNRISYEMKDAPLYDFAKKLSEITNVNLFIPPQFKTLKIDGFAKDIGIEDALYNISRSSNFNLVKESEKLYIIEPLLNGQPVSNRKRKNAKNVDVLENTYIIKEKNASLSAMITEVAEKTKAYVSFTEKVDDKQDIFLRFNSFQEFLTSVLIGTKYTYKKQDSTFYIGLKTRKEMHSHYLYKFNNRRVDSLSYLLPESIKEEIEIVEFPELNSLLFNGETIRLDQVKRLCGKLDQMIPLVLIDVIIIETSNSLDISSGVSAGLTQNGAEARKTGGTLTPEMSFTLNGASINNVLNRVGLSSIGSVSPNFYIQLQALEKNGLLDIKSTPKLSTLSGRKATLSIGETAYYEERKVSLYGTQNPGQQEQVIYRPISAKLGVDIRPIVTGDGYVNLDINVIQSSFTERIGKDGLGPPGLVAREFKSMIRVKNGETAILGGLERVKREKNNSGTPFLNRIPVLKLLFSNRSDNKGKSKFSIFISPTIIY